MRLLYAKQNGLCRQISTVDEIDKNAFSIQGSTVKCKALQGLTHNLSSSIELHIIFTNFDIKFA